jgi:hypothetical protein
VAVVSSWRSGDWPGAALFVGLAAAQGAAWTSLGLALATWIRRVERAVALSIVLALLIAQSWASLAFGVFHGPIGRGLAMASPFHGAFALTYAIANPRFRATFATTAWGLFWTAVALAAAVALRRATLATFDRCLGRIAERAGPPRRSRVHRSGAGAGSWSGGRAMG